jgi:esterase/lipase
MKTGPTADKTTKSSTVKIEGKKTHYLSAGQGPAVLLLHGYTQTSRMWRPLIERLKEKFTVYAPDFQESAIPTFPRVART